MKKTTNTILKGALGAALSIIVASCSTTESGTANSGEVKSYMWDTCIVSGNELGSMGDPVSLIHEGQKVKFCCAPCVKKFKADPARYLARR